MTGTVLVLGSNGRFGRSAAEAFWNAGWRVSVFDRSSGDLESAARGMDVIVNGWNPAYPEWETTVPKLTQEVISAAKSSGATILQPANVYMFGENTGPEMDENTPHAAENPLGQTRIEMETAYRDANVPVILLRAGDFLDTEASGNWFDKVLAQPLSKDKISYPGPLDTEHAWAYLPDMARAAVELCNMRGALPQFADIPFAGYTLTGHELATLCGQALGRSIRAKRMSWMPIYLVRPFWKVAKHLLEMKYLWHMPHRLDGTTFSALLPKFISTEPEEAIRMAISPIIEAQDQPKPDDAVRHPATAA